MDVLDGCVSTVVKRLKADAMIVSACSGIDAEDSEQWKMAETIGHLRTQHAALLAFARRVIRDRGDGLSADEIEAAAIDAGLFLPERIRSGTLYRLAPWVAEQEGGG